MPVQYKRSSKKGTNVRYINIVFKVFTGFIFYLIRPVSRSLVKYMVANLFFKPRKYQLSETEKNIIQKAHPFKFSSNGRTLQGYQWGEGPAVVFIHGWSGRAVQFYSYFDFLIRAGFSVLSFDHIGHGDSDGKTSSYFEFSDALKNFMDLQKDQDVRAIVAHSLGASAAVNYLWKTGNKIQTVLISPALFLVEMLEQTFSGYGVPKFAYQSVIRDIEIRTGHEFDKENPIDLIKTIPARLLIVHDIVDQAVSYEDSWRASLIHENIRLYSTKGLGHIRILRDESLAGTLAGFIIRENKDDDPPEKARTCLNLSLAPL